MHWHDSVHSMNLLLWHRFSKSMAHHSLNVSWPTRQSRHVQPQSNTSSRTYDLDSNHLIPTILQSSRTSARDCVSNLERTSKTITAGLRQLLSNQRNPDSRIWSKLLASLIYVLTTVWQATASMQPQREWYLILAVYRVLLEDLEDSLPGQAMLG